MYFQTADGTYKAVRGSSKLEGYHPHLHKVLPGTGYSPDLGGSLVMLFNGQWSLERANDNGVGPAYGHSEPWIVSRLHAAVKSEWRYKLPQCLHVPDSSEEQFGCDYKPPMALLENARVVEEELLPDADSDGEDEDAAMAAHTLATHFTGKVCHMQLHSHCACPFLYLQRNDECGLTFSVLVCQAAPLHPAVVGSSDAAAAAAAAVALKPLAATRSLTRPLQHHNRQSGQRTTARTWSGPGSGSAMRNSRLRARSATSASRPSGGALRSFLECHILLNKYSLYSQCPPPYTAKCGLQAERAHLETVHLRGSTAEEERSNVLQRIRRGLGARWLIQCAKSACSE